MDLIAQEEMTMIVNRVECVSMNTLQSTSIPVIVFGAGIVGQLLVHELTRLGVTVSCFADNSTAKAGTIVSNLEVIAAATLKTRYAEAIFIISVADVRDIVTQLKHAGYPLWVAGSDVLRGKDYLSFQTEASREFVEFAVGACMQCQDSYLHTERLFFHSVDIVITERCSLKCRDCSNLMQYYDQPQNAGIEEIVQSIDAFCAVVDDIHEFRVIGGEPFMNKQYPVIIRHLIEKQNVHRIVIYTNGTIVPRGEQLESLRHEKVMILLTDYGPLSPKSTELINLMKQNGIGYFARPADGWSECSSIMPHHRDEAAQKELFTSCCAKNLYTLSEGKLYRCPFVANAVRLGAIPDFPGDQVDIFSLSHVGRDEIRHQIDRLADVDYLKSCDFCTGRPLDAPTVTPAIQATKPMSYVRMVDKLPPSGRHKFTKTE